MAALTRSRLRTVLASGVALATAAMVAVVALREAAEPSSSGSGPRFSCPHWLSFVSTRTGRKQIYALDVRHPGEVVQITRLPGHAFDPTWSPDGRRVAFRWFRGGSVGLYVADRDGSNVHLLVDGGVTPSWSPDGRSIAHASPEGLSILDVGKALDGDPSASRVLTRSGPTRPQEYPAWSADGRRLVFAGYSTNGSYDIWVIDADGGQARNLTPRTSLDYGATWSRDGNRIVFGSSGARPGEADKLFVMNADGTKVRHLRRGSAPAWSPDGRWIAFVSTESGNAELYIMRPDETQRRRLTNHPGFDVGPPAWIGNC